MKTELKLLDRAAMASAKVPKEVSDPSSFIGDRGDFGPPLFAKLVPYAVHVAATIYEERRDRLINTNIIDELEAQTTKIHDTLMALGLPGSLQALEKPLGLPPSLVSHAEEIRQADAIMRLHRSFSDSAKLRESDQQIFAEATRLLDAEATEDTRLRMKHGTDRWNRPTSREANPALHAQVATIQGYLTSAASSDELVVNKFRECEPMLRILSGSDREIGNFVPSSRRVEIPPKLDEQVSALRSCLNEVSRFEARRRNKIDALRDKGRKDDISSSILTEAGRLEREFPTQVMVPAHFEDLFERRLTRYDGDLEGVQVESKAQEQLLQKLEKTHQSFMAAKAGWNNSREREHALQQLESAYFKYKEIVNNLEVGRKFYNDLGKMVGTFRDNCKALNYERREEATRMEV